MPIEGFTFATTVRVRFADTDAQGIAHNAAYLVHRASSEEFVALVRQQAEAHPEVVVDARGPWPPYSFAMLDDA